MAARSNFYEEILKEDYYGEKIASDNSVDTSSMLDAFSTEEMEALSEELNIAYEKKASKEQTIEEKIAEDTQVKREEDKEELAKKNAKKADGQPINDEREATNSEETETAKTVAEKEEIVNPEAKALEEKVVTASEYDEADLVKVAYEVAEEKLAEEGWSLADYVFSQIPNEKVANFVADKAEKLAYLSDKSSLQVADDILLNLSSILPTCEE